VFAAVLAGWGRRVHGPERHRRATTGGQQGQGHGGGDNTATNHARQVRRRASAEHLKIGHQAGRPPAPRTRLRYAGGRAKTARPDAVAPAPLSQIVVGAACWRGSFRRIESTRCPNANDSAGLRRELPNSSGSVSVSRKIVCKHSRSRRVDTLGHARAVRQLPPQARGQLMPFAGLVDEVVESAETAGILRGHR